jgi:hypothetical protein
MKKFYLFTILLFALYPSFATTKTLTKSTSNILDATAWSGGQLPQPGDTVIITAGKVLTLGTDITFPFSTQLLVYGEIHLAAPSINIYLDLASKIIIYNGGKLTGTVASQRIFLGDVQIYNGQQTVNGAMWAGQFTNGFIPFSTGATLPVKFVGFTVARKDNDALIQWSTSEEISADMYQVERSLDGSNWNTIAYVAAVGNSSATNNYSFTDKNISAKVVHYRIKEVDVDGKTVYTAIKSIKSETASVAEIKIAGFANKVLLQFPQEIKGNLTVRFVSRSGQVVDQQVINNPVGQVVLNSKITGNYIIAVSNGQGINTAKQVIL